MSDGERFYIVQTSGYPSEGGVAKYEHEYAVVDEATTRMVALFIASYGTRDRAGFAERKRQAHARARRLCKALNDREAGRTFYEDELATVGQVVRIRKAKDLAEVGEWEEEEP